MDLEKLGILLILLDRLPDELADVTSRLRLLEGRMSSVEDTIARMDAFTTALSADILTNNALIKELRDALAAGNQAAVDAALARLAPSLDRMEEIGGQLQAAGTGAADDPLTQT